MCVVCVLGEQAGEGMSVAEQSRELCRESVHGGIRQRKLTLLDSVMRMGAWMEMLLSGCPFQDRGNMLAELYLQVLRLSVKEESRRKKELLDTDKPCKASSACDGWLFFLT